MIAPKRKPAFNARCLFVALLVLASGAYADGTYQHTKDGKTIIWNPDPKPDDAATWSGSRDVKRYAAGDGTLTWYKVERKFGMGSRLPIEKDILLIRYSGNMVRGKLEGLVVAVDANGKTSHATFTDGSKSGEWAAGPALQSDQKADKPVEPVHHDTVAEMPAQLPSSKSESRGTNTERVVEQRPNLQAATSLPTSEQAANQRIAKSTTLELQVQALSPEPTPIPEQHANQHVSRHPPLPSDGATGPAMEVPAEGPLTVASPSAASSPAPSRPTEQRVSRRAPISSMSSGVQAEDLLRSMVIPPSTIGAMMKLRNAASPQPSMPSSSASPPALPRLSTAEVIGLADAEARKEGYDLGGYQCSKVDYTVADDAWSVMYDQKPVEGKADAGKHFIVSVADKTKKTSIVAGK